METDIIVLDGGRRAPKKYKVRIDLAKLTEGELAHLSAGISSVLELRRRGDVGERCWHPPAGAVEVFIVE